MSRHRIQRKIWALNRIIFAFLALMGILTAGVICQILAPLYSWYFFRDLNFTRYYRYLFPIMGCFFLYLLKGLKTPRFFSSFAIPLDAAPRMKPAEPGLRLHPSWTGSPDDCQACSRCCIQVHCPMLDRKTGICLSYGSFYWRYFNCGRYPANQFQIDCYRCPKWLFTKKFPE